MGAGLAQPIDRATTYHTAHTTERSAQVVAVQCLIIK